jgi:hypothetical protein
MLLTIFYRLPGLPGAAHTALHVLLLTVAMLAAVIAGVAVLVVIMPHLPTLVLATAIIGGYAMLTQPRKRVQSC